MLTVTEKIFFKKRTHRTALVKVEDSSALVAFLWGGGRDDLFLKKK